MLLVIVSCQRFAHYIGRDSLWLELVEGYFGRIEEAKNGHIALGFFPEQLSGIPTY